MRYIAFYLLLMAIAAFAFTAVSGSLAHGVTCELGTYGAVVEGCPR